MLEMENSDESVPLPADVCSIYKMEGRPCRMLSWTMYYRMLEESSFITSTIAGFGNNDLVASSRPFTFTRPAAVSLDGQRGFGNAGGSQLFAVH